MQKNYSDTDVPQGVEVAKPSKIGYLKLGSYESWAITRGELTAEKLTGARIFIVGSLIASFVIEIYARYLYSMGGANQLLAKFLSLIALVLLNSAALYLIFRLGRRNTLKWMVCIAAGAMLVAQVLTIIRGLPSVTALAPELSRRLQEFEGPLLILGLLVLLATYYLALLEAVSMKTQLKRERVQLYNEIAERIRTEESLAESRDQLRQLSRHIESSREAERARLAREVHDELGQSLTALKFELANLVRMLPPDVRHAPEMKEVTDAMNAQITGTVKTIRRIMTELHPAILDDLGFQAALEWLLHDWENRTGITCAIDSTTEYPPLEREVNTALFRIVQECLTNIVKHAEASRVEVRYEVSEDRVELDVSDNGRGITESQGETGVRRFGILGMRERVQLLGGDFTVVSEPGRGTRISVTIPYEEKGGSERHDATETVQNTGS